MITYFAFGSNLSPFQMTVRCPGSQVIQSGTLKGYKLAFSGFSGSWDGGVATILPDPSSEVQGVLYRLNKKNLKKLDRFEGFPFVYDRIQVEVIGENGKVYSALVYKKLNSTLSTPSMQYFHQIWKAYRDFDMDDEFLMEAIENSLDFTPKKVYAVNKTVGNVNNSYGNYNAKQIGNNR